MHITVLVHKFWEQLVQQKVNMLLFKKCNAGESSQYLQHLKKKMMEMCVGRLGGVPTNDFAQAFLKINKKLQTWVAQRYACYTNTEQALLLCDVTTNCAIEMN